MAYRILLKAAVTGGSAEQMASSVATVAEHLNEIERTTSAFLGFTLSSDQREQTALFSMYVDEVDPNVATTAAHAWAVTAINATGDATRLWATFAHPEERELVSS